ncbi:zinc finger protein zpr1 [Holotrichia oblita]|uniref:Zinc finger protein zpr1 n=1 Tax=Holotrichia oblita TaxID=644536 RepID=A0ACB9TGJ5_HOLOL|nr:zinc finger protein zpr1 [Holotrichia oblita]
MSRSENKPIFRELNADDAEPEITEIESLCMKCYENGTTKLLLTKIPYYKEVIIMSFSCDKCGYKNNEIQPDDMSGNSYIENLNAPQKDPKCLIQNYVRTTEQNHILGIFDREEISTGEGILHPTAEDEFPIENLENWGFQDSEKKIKLEKFVEKFDEILQGNKIVTVILDDPAGNSYIQSLRDDNEPDDRLKIMHYERNFEQNEELGLNDMKVENYETNS